MINLKAPGRVVIKVGTGLLTDGGGRLAPERFREFARLLSRHGGSRFVIVSSGAVAAGSAAPGMERPPFRLAKRQAAAAVGQTELMLEWSRAFGETGRRVGQVLLTQDVVTEREQLPERAADVRRAVPGRGRADSERERRAFGRRCRIRGQRQPGGVDRRADPRVHSTETEGES